MKEDRRAWQVEQLEKAQKKTLEAYELAADFEHQLDLKSNISEAHRKQELEDKKKEMARIKQEEDKRRAMLEALRAEKIAKLKATGMDAKYLAALENLNIEQLMRK